MALAWLVTLVAIAGVLAGALFVRREGAFSPHLAAGGGALLLGISVFWLIPEIAETSGRWLAFAAIALVIAALALLDRFLIDAGHSPRHGIIAPLLAATAIHSLLDGWSVRELAAHPVGLIAAPVGLALHKLPEGLALGWVLRDHAKRGVWQAIGLGVAAELCTVVGAATQPAVARFGPLWPAGVLAVIAGAFMFLGFHALVPNWKTRGVALVFAVTLALMAVGRIL